LVGALCYYATLNFFSLSHGFTQPLTEMSTRSRARPARKADNVLYPPYLTTLQASTDLYGNSLNREDNLAKVYVRHLLPDRD
jgi:hypothetical protein